MTAFDKWNERYKIYGCTKEQLQKLMQLKVITADEYKLITGEELTV